MKSARSPNSDLLDKQMKNHGLRAKEFVMQEQRRWDRESSAIDTRRGRGPEPGAAGSPSWARKAVTKIVRKEVEAVDVTGENLADFLGVAEVPLWPGRGKGPGRAWSPGWPIPAVGGELLNIEALRLPPGKGRMKTTGKLGDVMKGTRSTRPVPMYGRFRRSWGSSRRASTNGISTSTSPTGRRPRTPPRPGWRWLTAIVSVADPDPGGARTSP